MFDVLVVPSILQLFNNGDLKNGKLKSDVRISLTSPKGFGEQRKEGMEGLLFSLVALLFVCYGLMLIVGGGPNLANRVVRGIFRGTGRFIRTTWQRHPRESGLFWGFVIGVVVGVASQN